MTYYPGAIEAVQQMLNRYSVAASRADWDALLATFLPDARWAIPALGMNFAGHAEIRAGIAAVMAPMEYFVQINSPAVIEANGDVATATSVIREIGRYKGRDEALEVLGLYSDRLVRAAAGWRFVERVFELRGLQTTPLAPAPTAA